MSFNQMCPIFTVKCEQQGSNVNCWQHPHRTESTEHWLEMQWNRNARLLYQMPIRWKEKNTKNAQLNALGMVGFECYCVFLLSHAVRQQFGEGIQWPKNWMYRGTKDCWLVDRTHEDKSTWCLSLLMLIKPGHMHGLDILHLFLC